ncbi:hypothetical protein KY308_01710, partial [Candidatus Woesearchaeota archaeon]|nr:hypothetical protein [Candidatus Woesearchaeota archaeon]
TLEAGYSGANIINNESAELEEQAFNLTQKARDSMQRKEFYSAASYCYGANVIYSQMLILEQNISYQSLNKTIDKLAKDIEEFENKIDGSEKKTITDLESYMIAKQRLYEAKQNIEEFKSLLPNETMQYSSAAASSIERFNSAKSWFEFYGTSGAEIQIDKEAIKQSCIDKISEAEERYQYVDLYYPGLITSILGELAEAQKYFDSGNYELCLFTASKTKAEIDAVMSTIGVSDSKIDLLIDQRLKAAEKIIAEQNAKGYFPIFGYSYYEYALNLKRLNQSKPTALVYTQYAIELSKLDIYFKKKEPESKIKFDPELLRFGLVFLGGFVVGVAVYDLIIRKRGKKRKKKRH